MRPHRWLFVLAALSLAPLARAQDPALPETSAIKELGPGLYQIGELRLEQEARRVTFPAAVNQVKGLLEYLLVSNDGPRHESLLSTAVNPADLHLAMLLLGAKGSPQPLGGDALPSAQINQAYLKHAPQLTGERVSLTVRWKDASGAEKSTPAEDWLIETEANKPPARGPWIYSGSLFGQTGKFMAQVEGLFVALVTNPEALINNSRPGHDNDQVWIVNEKAVPPIDTPVQFQLQLLDKPATPEGK